MHHFRLPALSAFHDCLPKSQPRLYSCHSFRSSVHFNWNLATLASIKSNILYNCWNNMVSDTLSHMWYNYNVVYSLWTHQRTYVGCKRIGVDHGILTSVVQQDCLLGDLTCRPCWHCHLLPLKQQCGWSHAVIYPQVLADSLLFHHNTRRVKQSSSPKR